MQELGSMIFKQYTSFREMPFTKLLVNEPMHLICGAYIQIANLPIRVTFSHFTGSIYMPTRPYYVQNAITRVPNPTGMNLQKPESSHYRPSFHQQMVSGVMVILHQGLLAGSLVPLATLLVASSTARLKLTVCISALVWITESIVSPEASATAHLRSHQKRMSNAVWH